MVEYARKGLIGVLTPQANTTVEPEFAILMPPGYAFLNARMVSDKPTLNGRLIDYFDGIEHSIRQFADAPIGAFAFACTGSSYLQGIERERAVVEAVEAAHGIAFLTAGRAVADALRQFGASRIALVSPYPADLTQSSVAYWRAHGFAIETVVGIYDAASKGHPIYNLSASRAEAAVDAIDLAKVDAVVMLGTGMPTLGAILHRANGARVPILSCMSALAWRSLTVFDRSLDNAEAARRYFAGDGWREHFARVMA
jgi:maleate isomerase